MAKAAKKQSKKTPAKRTKAGARAYKSDVFASVATGKAAGDDITKAIKNADGRRGTGVSFFTVKNWATRGLVRLEAKNREVTSAILTSAGVKLLAS